MTSKSAALLLAAVVAWAGRGGQAQDLFDLAPPAPNQWLQRIEALNVNVVEPRWQPMGVGNQPPLPSPLDADQLRAKMRRVLDLHIDELRRVCRLAEPQLKKLQVAAKGARERAIEKAAPAQPPATISVQAHAAGGIVDVEQQPAVIVAQNGNGRIVRVWANGAQVVQVGPAINLSATAATVIKEPIWKNTVQRLLTYEQKQHQAGALEARAEYRRQAADVFDKLVVRLDELLLLDADQRQPLKKTIMQRQHAVNPRFGDNVLFVDMHLAMIVQQIPLGDLDPILTPAQLAAWRDLPEQLTFQPAPMQWGVPQHFRALDDDKPRVQIEFEVREERPQ